MSKLTRLAAGLKGLPQSRDTYQAARAALDQPGAETAALLADALALDPVVLLPGELLPLYAAIVAALPRRAAIGAPAAELLASAPQKPSSGPAGGRTVDAPHPLPPMPPAPQRATPAPVAQRIDRAAERIAARTTGTYADAAITF